MRTLHIGKREPSRKGTKRAVASSKKKKKKKKQKEKTEKKNPRRKNFLTRTAKRHEDEKPE